MSLAILVSALCSLFEAVLYSVPHGHVELLARSGKPSGLILKRLKTDVHKPIIAILTLNTIANTMGAAVAGAAAAVIFGNENLGWFSAVFTLAILLFSEILPKTTGVAYSKRLAPWTAMPIHWLVLLLTPIIWLCQAVTRLIPKKQGESSISSEEIQAIAILSRQSGEIEPEQEKVITNILNLKNKNVRQAMTPRTVTFLLSEHLSIDEAREQKIKWDRHSRVPVYDKGPDDIVGIILRKDVFLDTAEGRKELSNLVRPVHFVPEAAPLNRVLVEFFERRQNLFVVVDEYGGVTGVISMEDIIEEIVGQEIMDESDQNRDMRELARQKRMALTS